MTDAMIQQLLRAGRLKKQTAGFVQVEALLKQAVLDLTEAKKVFSVSAERATYILAYMAMLKAGRALLLMQGYVPDDGAQHKTVVDVTGEILGEKFKTIVLHFETMRRKRNDMTYEAGALVSLSESKVAFDDALQLVKTIYLEVKRSNPQMEMKFDI